MERDLNRRRFIKLTGAAGMAAIAGCAGDDGEPTTTEEPTTAEPTTEEPEPTTEEEVDYTAPTETESSLIEPETLYEWQEAGLVNTDDTAMDDRVVIFRVDTDGYDSGHVPGAVKLSTSESEGSAVLTETRLEGLAETPVLVASGSVIDEIIQRAGVGQNTTVVLSGKSPMRVARAYWTLRYWGFPRNRVKVLNGGTSVYGEEYDLSFETPDHPTSNYTVKAFEMPNYDLRIALNELIQRVDDKNDGNTDDVFLDHRGDTTPRPAGSTPETPESFLQGDDWGGDSRWQDADTIADHIWGHDGVEEGNMIITFCRSGYRAALGFFALDGIMEYDNVAIYDASVGMQWVHYDADNDPVPNDAWRTDINGRTEGDTADTDETPLTIDPDLNEELTELAQLDSNQVKKADIEYMGGDTSGGGFGCGS